MTRTHFQIIVEIPVPPRLVWSAMADVERWPEWTASVTTGQVGLFWSVTVGGHVRIHQPKQTV